MQNHAQTLDARASHFQHFQPVIRNVQLVSRFRQPLEYLLSTRPKKLLPVEARELPLLSGRFTNRTDSDISNLWMSAIANFLSPFQMLLRLSTEVAHLPIGSLINSPIQAVFIILQYFFIKFNDKAYKMRCV